MGTSGMGVEAVFIDDYSHNLGARREPFFYPHIFVCNRDARDKANDD